MYKEFLSTDDEIMDYVLRVLYESHAQEYPFENLPFEDKEQIYDGSLPFRIVNVLKHHDLVELCGTIFGSFNIGLKITPKGSSLINEYGSWLDFKVKKAEETKQQDYKEKLEIEKSERELEKLEYEKSIRALDEKVKYLTSRNLRLQNLQITWTFLGILGGLISSIFLEKYFSIIKLIISLF